MKRRACRVAPGVPLVEGLVPPVSGSMAGNKARFRWRVRFKANRVAGVGVFLMSDSTRRTCQRGMQQGRLSGRPSSPLENGCGTESSRQQSPKRRRDVDVEEVFSPQDQRCQQNARCVCMCNRYVRVSVIAYLSQRIIKCSHMGHVTVALANVPV